MQPLWIPSRDRIAQSNMTVFRGWLEERTGRSFDSYPALHGFSCEDVANFWELFVEYTGVIVHSPYRSVLPDSSMPGALPAC